MTDPHLIKMDANLRRGNPKGALEDARAYCQSAGATREAAIEIAKAAATAYRDLVAEPVHEFANSAAAELPSEVGVTVGKALLRLVRMTEEWEKKLWSIHAERLARELRDWTRMRHFEPAAANAARMMALVPEGERMRRATYIGNVLGTVINNQTEAKQVASLLARNANKYHVRPEEAEAIEAAREARIQKMVGVSLDNLEREYSSILTQYTVEIKGVLPDQNRMDDPDEGALRDAGDVFRSILRVPIWKQEPDLFLDATHVLLDFLPKEHTATAKASGADARLYNSLGMTAKKTVMQSFQEIGKNAFFTKLYKEWAKDYVGTDALGPIVEVMGALRSQDFADFFDIIKGDKKLSESVNRQMGSALGAMAGGVAADTLMGELKSILGRKRLESGDIREATATLTNLGLIVKSPRTGDQERGQIREFVRSHVPEDISKLARHAALQIFQFKAADQTPVQRQWAVRVLTKSLWAPDETTAMQKGEEGRAAPLGPRQEAVDALIKLGPLEAQTLVRTMEPLVSRYGAAFMAAAEVLEKVGSPEGHMVLERMLNSSLMHDDAGQNAYQQEFQWDPALNQRVPLTKDKVIGPVIYAIGMIGGPRSLEILKRYQDQISSGRVPPPTGEIANYMARFIGDSFGKESTEEQSESGDANSADMHDVTTLIKQVSSRYFFSGTMKRRASKISALTRLGMLAPAEALDVVFRQLADKDPMVVSAAITCLSEYASPKRQKQLRDLTINTCLDTLESRDPAMRAGGIKLLKEIGPNRKDVKDKVIAYAKTVQRREVKEALGMALKTGSGADPLEQMQSLSKEAGGTPQAAPPSSMSQLEMKRQYLSARKAWIDSGKQGDPPAKPAEME